MTSPRKLGAASLVAGALLVGATSASADTVYDATTNAPLAPGAAINGVNVGNTLLQASNMTITCQNSTATGALGATNPTAPGTAVGGAVTALTFSGTAANNNRCTTNSTALPYARVSTSVSSATPATVAALAGSPGSFNVTSTVNATIDLFSTATNPTASAVCRYTASSVMGSVPAGSNQVTFNQALTPSRGNAFVCPPVMAYRATQALTSGGAPIRIATP